MSEIEALALKAAQLSASADFWNKAMLWGLAIAALAAVFIVITTRLAIVRTGQAGDAQSQLEKAKDRQLALELKARDEHIAGLETEALSLKKQLIAQGPRVVLLYPEETRNRLIEALKPFHKQKAEVSFCSLYLTDNDTAGLAMQLRGILIKAGWSLTPVVLEGCSGTGIVVWRSPNAPKSTQEAAEAALSALQAVPFEVLGKRVYVNPLRRSPQYDTIQDGKQWLWEPPTDDTVFITVYAHP